MELTIYASQKIISRSPNKCTHGQPASRYRSRLFYYNLRSAEDSTPTEVREQNIPACNHWQPSQVPPGNRRPGKPGFYASKRAVAAAVSGTKKSAAMRAGSHGQRFSGRGLFSCPMLQRQVVNRDGTRRYRCPVQSKFAVTRPRPEEPTVRTGRPPLRWADFQPRRHRGYPRLPQACQNCAAFGEA